MVLSLFACEKIDFDCDYTITSYTESREKGDKITTEGVILHSFYADTSLWEITSYADAIAGKLTGRKANVGQTKMADMTLRSGANGVATFRSLNQEGVIMIACDESSKRYAWRVSEVYKGLERVNVSVIFQLWHRSETYHQGNWIMVDEFASDRSKMYEVNSFVESSSGGEKSPIAGVNMHAFYADSSLWEVKNYADAVAGTITKRDGSGVTMSADVSSLSDTEGLGILDIAEKPAIIVASDSDRRYGWVVIESDTRWRETAVIFQLWRREARYLQKDWIMVDEIASERPIVDPAS